jgi:hypothetical protein
LGLSGCIRIAWPNLLECHPEWGHTANPGVSVWYGRPQSWPIPLAGQASGCLVRAKVWILKAWGNAWEMKPGG